MDQRSDEQRLVEEAARGDTAAFGRLVGRYRASVHAYIVSRIGDFDWADDIAQESFVAAFRGLAQLRDPSRFSAWLRAIADNMCALWLRRTQRERSLRDRTPAPGVNGRGNADEAMSEDLAAAARDALGQIWSLAHFAAEFVEPEDSAAASCRRERIAGLVAAGEELAMVVSALDASRERILAALRKGRGQAPADGEAGRGTWPLPLAERIGYIVEGRWRRRDEHERFLRTELGRRAAEYHRRHPGTALPCGGLSHSSMPASVRTLPEDREYGEKELTRLIAAENSDPALARRRLYEEGWMARTGDRYRLSERGRRAWRTERLLAGARA